MSVALPRGVALTCVDMETMPDDGHRYELIDGTLVVTPAPIIRHEVATVGLLSVLRAARPAGLSVLTAPVDFRRDPDIWLQPDLMVVEADQTAGAYITRPPVLVAEIMSPSSRAMDLGSKRLTYARLGVPDYWIVDPDEPSVLFLTLEAGDYREIGRVVGDEAYDATRPYPVTIVASQLLIP